MQEASGPCQALEAAILDELSVDATLPRVLDLHMPQDHMELPQR